MLQTCRNSEILVAEDTSEEDAKIIHLGIRIDTFNQTRLFQQGNLCGSVLEVCCNVNKGKRGNNLWVLFHILMALIFSLLHCKICSMNRFLKSEHINYVQISNLICAILSNVQYLDIIHHYVN